MIEIILAALVTILTAVARYFLPKGWDKKFKESVVILFAFGFTIFFVGIYFLLTYKKMIPEDFFQTAYPVMLQAVGLWEIVYKQIIKKIIESL